MFELQAPWLYRPSLQYRSRTVNLYLALMESFGENLDEIDVKSTTQRSSHGESQ